MSRAAASDARSANLAPMAGQSAQDPRIGVIMLVADRWRGIWMPRHQVSYRLADHFDVVWVEAARPWREYFGPGRRKEEIIQDVTVDSRRYTVFDPGWRLPEVYKPRWLRDAIRKARVRAAERILRGKGCTKIILYLWRPEFAWALDAVPADVTCYHIDDEYTFTPTEQPNDPQEVALIRRVNHVFIHSPRLLQKKGGINVNTTCAPNGVDYSEYSTVKAEPADLAGIPHPRVGYVGVVKAQLDLDLLLTLAERHPEWQFVIVGPRGFLDTKANVLDKMGALPNVHLLGNRPVPELPAYVQHLDVCTMPYEITDYTNFIYPLKLHEYLATGRPTIAKPIASLVSFGDVVWLATSVSEWESALQAALRPEASSPAAVAARQSRAAEHDWNLIVSQIAGQLRARMADALSHNASRS
jgi:glycosyltransferase involved in cell wall biosynthesis